jgi:putative ABC transport system permease protein
MRALHRKLWRDLGTLKGQIAAIVVVLAAGVMTLILFLTTLDALSATQDRFYEEHRFADLFADLVRAPDAVGERLRDIPGVEQVETRVRAAVRLEVEGFPDPVRGHLLSIPDGRQPEINRLYLREGRLPISGRSDEVVVSEAFAAAHRLRAGDRLRVIIRGSLEELAITGTALGPEFVYQVAPTDLLPDYERYAILWMNRRALASASAMEGAFNNVVLTLHAGATPDSVKQQIDWILARYGGIGAYGREDQVSHRFLSEELDQLRVMATILPTIFLGVAAFLLHVLMGRIIRTQREQVAVLKAFGYRNSEIGLHYGLLTGLIVGIGSVLGVVLGAWAADAMARLYLEYYRFPALTFRLPPWVILVAVTVAGGSAALGVWGAVRSAVKLPPAEAMRPAPPARFRRGWLDQSRVGQRLIGPPTLIIIRNLSRYPLKATLSVLGIGLAGALLVVGHYQFNAVDHMIDLHYRQVLRMDLHLTFTEATPERAVGELRHLPGALYVEPYRAVRVRLVNGPREYRTEILGTEARSQLRGLMDARGRLVTLPPTGLLMTDFLAADLGLRVGDEVEVEFLEGHRRTLRVPLAGMVDEPIGVSAYMERRALNRLMWEGPAISGAWLLIDRAQERELWDRLWKMPEVAGIGLIGDAEENIRAYMGDTILVFMGILLLLAGSIAGAVVYNNARITFAERARELATLRVLGFTRWEVAWVLLGEIAFLTALALPVGWLTGTLFAVLFNRALAMDIFRIPFVMTPQTFAFAATGVIAASILSALLMVRRVQRLDMVSALKATE